jgi:hypothetical protein
MTEKAPKKNGYEDSDLKQILDEIEEFEDQKVSIRAKAAGECGGISKKIGNTKGRAKELNIPLAALNALLKTRKLERQMDAIAHQVPDDYVEIFDDMTGQFSMFSPDEGESPAAAAAQRRKTEAQENQEREQEEGAKILDGLVH